MLVHRFQVPYRRPTVESVLVFGLIPQALVPLTALLFASGMVQDDVEEQTLTYLLIRPIPRWPIYLAKLAGDLAGDLGPGGGLHVGGPGRGLLGRRATSTPGAARSAGPCSSPGCWR